MSSRRPITIPLKELFLSPPFDGLANLGDIIPLKHSILSEGLLQPLHVRKVDESFYKVVHGRRCYSAIVALSEEGFSSRFTHLPCKLVEGAPEEDLLTLLACHSLSRAPREEEINSLIRELAMTIPPDEIARRTGLSLERVTQAMTTGLSSMLRPAPESHDVVLEPANLDTLRSAIISAKIDEDARRALDDIIYHVQRYLAGKPVADRTILHLVKTVDAYVEKVRAKPQVCGSPLAP